MTGLAVIISLVLMLPMVTLAARLVIDSLRRIRRQSRVVTSGARSASKEDGSFMAVLGSGGHTSEMLTILAAVLRDERSSRITRLQLVVADTDKGSISKASRLLEKANVEWYIIPRCREVGQSYLTTLFSTIKSFLSSLYMVWSSQPSLLLVNGPGTCVPVVLAVAVLQALGGSRCICSIIYVESVCRVETLSLTGLILYHLGLCDSLVVQWEPLVRKWPRARYLGCLL